MLNKIRLAVTGQSHEVKDPSLPHSAILIPITDCLETPELVLTKRSEFLSRHAGEVCFPGGKWEEGDKSLEHTALREAHEEVGLSPASVEVLGQTPPVVSRSGLNVTPYVGIIDKQAELTPNPGELDSIFKVPLDYFLDHDNIQAYSIKYNGGSISTPSYRYDGYIIWGLTAYMILDLMNRSFDADLSFKIK